MTIEFTLSPRQRELQSLIHQFAASIVRPEALKWDREHGVPNDFLSRIVMMAKSMGQSFTMGPNSASTQAVEMTAEERKKRQVALTTMIGAEEMAWGDAGLAGPT